MFTLLVVIYLAFISLGLPDSLLGAAWPSMRPAFQVPLSYAGAVSMIVTAGTVVSSLLSARLIRRFRTGLVTLISVCLTAFALAGVALAPGFWFLCLMAVPLGLGAGSVDAALNNYVATHYEARHMSWLHCFWGIGATVGPVILSAFMPTALIWRGGYGAIAVLQFILAAGLLFALPLWNKQDRLSGTSKEDDPPFLSNREALKLPGIPLALLTFFCYCGAELGTGLWASSFLVEQKGLTDAAAALWVSLYYGGITAGRLLCGFLAARFSNPTLIRAGWIACMAGALFMLLPLPAGFSLFALILLGLGCAPIYPLMIQETPARFGRAASQAAMGLQMAIAYVGSTVLPPLLGALAGRFSLAALPWFLIALFVLIALSSERLNHYAKGKER